MEEKITFEDFGIEFDDSDFEGVSKDTLEECIAMIDETIDKMEEGEA